MVHFALLVYNVITVETQDGKRSTSMRARWDIKINANGYCRENSDTKKKNG